MFKSLATSLLLSLTAASSSSQNVPPHGHNCRTSSDPDAIFALGLSRDYDMGGCKCEDDSASWGPGGSLEELWACYCQVPDQYMSYATPDLKSDMNRRQCGVITECQQAAVLQQKNLWAQEMARLKKERKQTMRLNDKQLVKENELNVVRHTRKERTQQNRIRAKLSLQILADEFKKVKLAFVNGNISQEAMAKAHAQAAQQVASVRQQYVARQTQIDDFYKNAMARTITMESFVDQDQAKLDNYYKQQADKLKQRYGSRIQEYMMTPIIENIYKQYNLDSNDPPAATTLYNTAGWTADSANLRDQKDTHVCPLYQ